MADDALVQQIFEVHQLVHLAFHETADRHAGPLRHHLGNVLGVDFFLQHPLAGLQRVEVLGGVADAAFEFGNASVADLCRFFEIRLAFGMSAQRLQLLFQGADRGNGLTLGLPVLLHLRGLRLQRHEFVVQGVEALTRRDVGLLLQGNLFDLQLQDAPLDNVDLGGQRVDLDAQLARRFVDQVDGLVGKKAIGEIAVRQHRGADQRTVLDAHTMVHLVAFLQPAEDGDGVLHRRFAHVHLLEATLERGILLHVLAVLVERGGTDHAQLAAGEHRLDHVAGIHRTFGAAGTHQRVHLVDEGDHVALGVGDLLQHRLQALLELAAVLCTGQHRPDVERHQSFVLQSLGHVAVGDSPRKALDDGGLADAGFADENGVVLRAPREHLNDTTDLFVAADDRVDLAFAGTGREVLAVLLERLELFLGIRRRDSVRAPHLAQRIQQLLAGDPDALVHGEQEMFDRQVVVVQVTPRLVGILEDVVQLAVHPRLFTAIRMGQLGDCLVGLVAQHQRRNTQFLQHRRHDGAVLSQHRRKHVVGGDFGVAAATCVVE